GLHLGGACRGYSRRERLPFVRHAQGKRAFLEIAVDTDLGRNEQASQVAGRGLRIPCFLLFLLLFSILVFLLVVATVASSAADPLGLDLQLVAAVERHVDLDHWRIWHLLRDRRSAIAGAAIRRRRRLRAGKERLEAADAEARRTFVRPEWDLERGRDGSLGPGAPDPFLGELGLDPVLMLLVVARGRVLDHEEIE